MNDFLTSDNTVVLLLPLALVVMLLVWLAYRRRAAKAGSLSEVINDIAHERIDSMVLANGDDGEIQIDHLLLTANGLLILHIKDVQGAVFGGDKMQEWTVISDDRRFTFNNPQSALYDRIAAVRHVVRQVPVAGRIVFLDGAQFNKGVPNMVCTLEELHKEFGEVDKGIAKFKVDAFRQHWEHLQTHAVSPAA